jgi:hypothetical protein
VHVIFKLPLSHLLFGEALGVVVQEVKKSAVSGKDNLWILDLLDNTAVKADLNGSDVLRTRASKDALCVVCKGSKMLCGKTRCPVMVRVNQFFRAAPLIQGVDVNGASPPSVFVGRIGYPYVFAGPMVPPVHEDTSFYDLPELWFGKPIDEIVGFRSMLIRGKHRVHVRRFGEAGKIMDMTRELALAADPTDVELGLTHKPRGVLMLDDDIQPFGPSAPIRDLRVGNTRWDHQVEKAYLDTDLKAADAVKELFAKGVLVTKLQRALSVGAFGVEANRRLVPTRWSITAVDSILSKDLMEKIKGFPEINEFRIYESIYLENQFEVLMLPDCWSYEAIEAWYPGTVWNPKGKWIAMFGDWEDYDGRTTYAEIGGCYYAARLAVCELLMKERRQARVIVLREARPGYIMPVGVWQVRENVRNAMRQTPLKYNTLEEALKRIADQFQIPIQQWINKSQHIKNALYQKKITQYIKHS